MDIGYLSINTNYGTVYIQIKQRPQQLWILDISFLTGLLLLVSKNRDWDIYIFFKC